MIDDIHDPSSSCDINVSKVSIDFIFKSIYQPSIIINQPNIIIDVNSNITSKNHHHDKVKHDNTNNSNGMKDNINNDHNIHDADNYDDNRTSYYYTGRHDNGHLPILQTSNKEALELLSCLLEAKNKCDNYLTSCIDHEYGYNNNNSTNNDCNSSKDIEGEAVVNDVVDVDRVPDTAEEDDDDADDDESSVVTKKIKLDTNIGSCCNSKAIN
jgi:hypothetical protein